MSVRDYQIRITRRAEKDIKKLTPKLKAKLYDVLTEVIAKDPFQGKKLIGDLEGSYSYRLSFQDRIVLRRRGLERSSSVSRRLS